MTKTPGQAATADHRSYHLSNEEVARFDETGYLILRDRLPQQLLRRLQDAADQWILDGRTSSRDDPQASDYKFAARPSGPVLFRVDYLHSKRESASLELLGSPAVLGIAESLAGANFVPTYESMVFKKAGDGAPINWHQDATHPRTHRIFNVDVYLDASRQGAGALQVIPRSQESNVDICDLEDAHGWDVPGLVHVEMDPGDILVHDTMLVHGSKAATGNALRRTVYYEFRPAEQIAEEGPWERSWVDKRMRLIPLGLSAYGFRYPDAEQFVWSAGANLRPPGSDDVADELRVVHSVGSPGSFCSAGSVPVATTGGRDAQSTG